MLRRNDGNWPKPVAGHEFTCRNARQDSRSPSDFGHNEHIAAKWAHLEADTPAIPYTP